MPDLKMPQVNNVIISGRLVYDGELKTSGGGTSYARNRLAVDEGFGEKKTTSFFAVVAFGKVAEKLAAMRKGAPVYAEGRIRMNKREKGDVVEEYAEITLYRVDCLTWDNEPDTAEKTPPRPPQAAQEYQQPEDDIPF
jgi:single-strand DNA-binding protein